MGGGGDTVQASPLPFFSFFLSVLHFWIQFSGEAWARAGLQGWVIGRMPRSRMGLAARSDLATAVLCLGTGSPCLPRAAPFSFPIRRRPRQAGFLAPEEEGRGRGCEQRVPPPSARPSGGTARVPPRTPRGSRDT